MSKEYFKHGMDKKIKRQMIAFDMLKFFILLLVCTAVTLAGWQVHIIAGIFSLGLSIAVATFIMYIIVWNWYN